jgi:hypothetical protein
MIRVRIIIGVVIVAGVLVGVTATSSAAVRRSETTCSLGQLTVSVTAGLGGAGHFSSVILVRNHGASTCHLKGYPKLRFFNARGTEAAEAVQTPTGFTGGLPIGALIPSVELGKGEVASAVMEGTDIPTGGATTCPSFRDYTITLPGVAHLVHIDHGIGSCSGVYVHPLVIGFNGTYPSGEVVGRAPACKRSANDHPAIGPFVEVQAVSGSSVAGMVIVAASSKARPRFQLILKPGRYTIRSTHDRSMVHVAVRAGQFTLLGTYGSCYQVTSVPTTVPGLGSPTRTTTTSITTTTS